MERKYRLADVNILIKTNFDFSSVERYRPFVFDFDKPDITYEFTVVDQMPAMPNEPLFYDGMIRIYRRNGITFRCYSYYKQNDYAILSDERISERIITVYVLRSQLKQFYSELKVFDHLAIEHVMAIFKGTLLHSSFISYNGKAILFTAPSQTGKSTQAELWRKHKNADVINGDRSLIKLKDNMLYAYSLPYCGTSNICKNYNIQIQAIVILRQAPYNRISTLKPSIAFRDLFEGCAINTWYNEDVLCVCDIVEQIIKSVPVYLLECLPNEEAVEVLANELSI